MVFCQSQRITIAGRLLQFFSNDVKLERLELPKGNWYKKLEGSFIVPKKSLGKAMVKYVRM